MNRTWLPAVVLILGAATYCPADELDSFQFTKGINHESSGEEDIVAVELDSDIYAATEDRFADLRVVDGQNNDLPYILETVTEKRTESVQRTRSVNIESLAENDDNSIEIVIQRDDDDPPAEGIVLHTPLKNFERQVSVFGSSDANEWKRLVADALIFDYSRYMDIANSKIILPDNDYRNLKVVIKEVTDEDESPLTEFTRRFRQEEETQRTERTTVRRRPLRINSIELWHHETRELLKRNKKVDYPVAKFRVEELPDQKQTIVHVRTRREPLTELSLGTPSANFSRRAVVQVPVVKGVTTTWTEIGSAKLSKFRFRGFQRDNLDIEFPEHRSEEYRIVIFNEDNKPLEIAGVKAQGNVHRAMFFAAPKESHQLYYGRQDAQPPSYDTAALSLVLGKGFQPVAATLGPEEKNEKFDQAADLQLKTVLNSPLFFGGVICVVVAVLALLLFRASRRIEV